MPIYHSEGRAVNFTAGADIVAGQIVAVDNLKGIVDRPTANGAIGALSIEGVYRITSTVDDPGDLVKFRTTEQDAVAIDAGDRYDGIVVGVYSTGVSLVKLAQGESNADTVSGG